MKRQQRVFYHDTMPAIRARLAEERAPLKSKFESNLEGVPEEPPKKTLLEQISAPKRYQTRAQRAA